MGRLLPVKLKIEHIPGKSMGFADYFSRNPSGAPAGKQRWWEICYKYNSRDLYLKPTGYHNQSESSTQNERNDVINANENTHKENPLALFVL